MPGAERANVDLQKVRDYFLSAQHPRGRHKARVFESALGLTAANADDVRGMLLAAAQSDQAVLSDQDQYGQRYIVDVLVSGPAGQAVVRSSWIIRTGEDFPRLTSCFVR